MKRLIFALLLFVTFSLISSQPAQASTLNIDQTLGLKTTNPIEDLLPKEEKIKKYTFLHQIHKTKPGDTVESIAAKFKVSPDRLWQKNPGIKNPLKIPTNKTLIIPLKQEKLATRELLLLATINARPAILLNTYYVGQCTWYVKERRPDIPNTLGNADTWDDLSPFPTGNVPKVGAVGVTKAYMHVVYIEKIKGDQVYLSEMNYVGEGVKSFRWASVSEFTYIY